MPPAVAGRVLWAGYDSGRDVAGQNLNLQLE